MSFWNCKDMLIIKLTLKSQVVFLETEAAELLFLLNLIISF